MLVGDTTSKTTCREDKSSWPLFGDAGTATAIEYDNKSEGFVFHAASDGSGFDAIRIPDGGCRSPFSPKSLEYSDLPGGGKITPMHCKLEGMDVFSFAISKAPKSVKKVLETIGKQKEEINFYLFHQANKFLNETIRTKLKLTPEQVPYNLDKYGNTSCASIPLLMVTNLRDQLQSEKLEIIGCGFGVGLSWNTVYLTTDGIVCPKLIEYDE